MRVAGMMRVKDEARWIEKCIRSILPVCDKVFVLDDHSTDGTLDICESIHNVLVYPSSFDGLDEVRDKNFLLAMVQHHEFDWILHIDGDEALRPESVDPLMSAFRNARAPALSPRVLYLWDSEDVIRVDRVYGNFRRASAFRSAKNMQFRSTTAHGFHCGNVPHPMGRYAIDIEADLLHYGYMHKADRLRKYRWYNDQDPGNASEDCYRHIVQGDIPDVPADAVLRHAGPMEFLTLSRAS